MAFKRSSVRSRLSPPENANGFAVRVFRWIDTKVISDPKRSHPVYLRQQILARKNALRLRGQTISTRKRERFCRLRFTMDRYKGDSDPKGRIPSICGSKYLPAKTNSNIKLKWNYLLRLHKTVYQP